MKSTQYTLTTQAQLRRAFREQFPALDFRRITDYAGTGKMYRTDTRVTWCDWLDMLCKGGEISGELAHRATLD